MSGYIGAKQQVALFDSYTKAQSDGVIATNRRNKNLLINGGFDVWQRGTSFTGSGYGADRWRAYAGTSAAMAVTKADASALDSYGLTLKKSAASSYHFVGQLIESIAFLKGKTVTLSLEIYGVGTVTKASVGVVGVAEKDSSAALTAPTFLDESTFDLTPNDTTRITKTVTLPDYGSDTYTLAVKINIGDAVTSETGNIYIRKVQLEEGAVATPFEHRSYSEELALCQRYYLKTKGELYGNTKDTAIRPRLSLFFIQEMRIAPTVVLGTLEPGSGGVSVDLISPQTVYVSNNTSDEYPHIPSGSTFDAEL